MSNERDPLNDAFAELRDAHDGSHPTSDASLRQVLLRTRNDERRRSVVRWFVLPAAAALFAGTAFAATSGKLDAVIEALHLGHRPPTPNTTSNPEPPQPLPAASATSPMASSGSSGGAAEEPETSGDAADERAGTPSEASGDAADASAGTPSEASGDAADGRAGARHALPARSAAGDTRPRATSVVRHGEAATSVPDAPVEPKAPADPNAALYEDAHRAHFVERVPDRALRAWDAYLAAAKGHGRFVPEARYNRALSLVRLGRTVEAERELAAFAGGAYGDYRKREAHDLLEALARDE